MSEKNVEIVREFAERFATGGPVEADEVWQRYFDPEVVWDTSASGMPMAGVYHGWEGVRKFWIEWLGPWDDWGIEHTEYIDAGDAVVLVSRQTGTGKGSGVRIESDFFAVWDLKDSKIVSYRLYESRAEALAAAGLSE
jgi:uncharacterized protein